MGGGDYAYEGANYGFDPEYGGFSQNYSSKPETVIGLSTDARTANVLKEVSSKLNTGATTIETTQVFSEVFESIPKEHFKELDRLRKLLGNNVELTLHAPIVEPTGMTKKGWDPSEREQAERQMIGAIEKAHDLNPKGNVVTTFHASAVSLPGEVKIWEERKVNGETKKVPIIKEIYIIDERSGGIDRLPLKPSQFEGGKEVNAKDELDKLNRANWYKNLQHINFAAENGAHIVEEQLNDAPGIKNNPKEKLLSLYKDYTEGKGDKIHDAIKAMETKEGITGLDEAYNHKMQKVLHGDLYLRDAYNGLRDMFDQAYDTLKKDKDESGLDKLEAFRKKVAPKLNYLTKPEKVNELAETIRDGVRVLRSIEAPKIFKPFKDFAIDKSSETFADVALHSFKKFGDSSPIISIENPPAGAGAIYNGEDLRDLIQASRDKFAAKAVDKLGMSEAQAQKEAKKIIGATWDVGHINMLRKYGAGEDELKAETKAIAPMVKHIHLSDNFGMEHTELPMGMGNVPNKEIMKIIGERTESDKKVKKIVEAMHWYQHFQTAPFAETLQNFGSPMYTAGGASYWGAQGGYFAGYGMNPEIHHSLYGAGFSNLPVELGGQMSGRSRVSGAPME